MKALILVDIQIDFLPGGALPVPDGHQIIPVVNSMQHHFNLVVATQDWHPPGHNSFASAHSNKNPFDRIELHGLPQVLWPDHCVQGSNGAGFPDSLSMNRVEAIFRKGTDPDIDSYSAFFDNGHRKSTGLAGYLREKSVTEVYLAGLAGDICVYYTAMDSLQEGFTTFFVEDATRPLSPVDYEKLAQQFTSKGGRLLKSFEIS